MLPAPAHQVVINVDYGGQLTDYSARVNAYLKRKVHIRIEGECASACTLVTALPAERICVATNAKLEFHQAYNPDRFNPLSTAYRNPIGTSRMMKAYPPALEDGADMLRVMDVTRHRSIDTLKGYNRRAKAFVGHAGKGFL